jgi:rRNA processing protein Gar1
MTMMILLWTIKMEMSLLPYQSLLRLPSSLRKPRRYSAAVLAIYIYIYISNVNIMLKTVNEMDVEVVLGAKELENKVDEAAQLVQVGKVLNKLGTSVVVQAYLGSPAIVEGTILCCEDRSVVGEVNEIFGPVAEPHYLIITPKSFAGTLEKNTVIFSVRNGVSI